ncbi:MAG: DNA polymerase III subunit delta' [Gammaproteobacteria bacterium]|nr:DNA polymerase III subunit delta' [Gammaproteobacteria bacterium]
MIYPWQQSQWQNLQTLFQQKRLPHGLLLKGIKGTGKFDFATGFGHSLLCHQRDQLGHACGACGACQLLEAGTHPDFLVLEPESSEKAIKVDDIRELCKEMQLTSQFSGYKVAIINPADNMNINAANSLLKTLEEPTDNVVLILVSSKPHRLPVTIRSRCQSIAFSSPDTQTSMDWLTTQGIGEQIQVLLNLAYGSPLAAKQLAENEGYEQRNTLIRALVDSAANKPVIQHSEQLSKIHNEQLLNWLYDWLTDLIHIQQGCDSSVLVHGDRIKDLTQIAGKISLKQLYLYMDQLNLIRRAQSIPMNAQLLWEDLLISWNQHIKL